MMVDDADRIPISLVAHTVFCRRRAWLEAAGETVESSAIQFGQDAHRRVDHAGGSDDRYRAVPISSPELGLTGRCDVVIGQPDEGLEVVEFKSTPVRRTPSVTEAQGVQLTLQRLCLELAGHQVRKLGVYFVNHEIQVEIPINEDMASRALTWLVETKAVLANSRAPEPLVSDPRCDRCSHASVCLPDETGRDGSARRISVADPDTEILHVQTYGCRVQLRSHRVQVVKGDEILASLPLERVGGIVVFGNCDLSSAVIRELLWRRAAIVWCTGRGRVVGWASSAETPHGLERAHQHLLSLDGSLPLAREAIRAKVSNQATAMRRHNCPDDATALRVLARRLTEAPSLPALLALEGEAAARYFSRFPEFLKGVGAEFFREKWERRRGRGAGDPLNIMLNFCYGLLVADAIRAVTACGLDPAAGFLHSSSRNKPALALDLMEEFRAPVADSVVVGTINNGEITAKHFSSSLGDWRLRDSGRKALVAAYERRVGSEFQHPIFGYKVTWRRALEVQARMVLAVIEGSRDDYRGIVTR